MTAAEVGQPAVEPASRRVAGPGRAGLRLVRLHAASRHVLTCLVVLAACAIAQRTALHGRVGLLAANVPYIPTGEIGLLPAEARLHEPRAALDGGPDGLDVLRRVAAAAPCWLAPGGHLLSETSERQAPRAVAALTGSGLVPRVARSEELSATVVIGTRPARS